jgi:hypothetical protein
MRLDSTLYYVSRGNSMHTAAMITVAYFILLMESMWTELRLSLAARTHTNMH